MKIGVFGDSFANSPEGWASMQYHWSTLLKNELNATVLDNYGQPGSSIYFSYKNFINNHSNYDLNIFVVTEPGRYIKPIEISPNNFVHIPNMNTIADMVKLHKNQKLDKKTTRMLEDWFLCSDDDFNQDMSTLMIEKILEIGNVIIIPAFPSSLSAELSKKLGVENFALSSLVDAQFSAFGVSYCIPYLYGESSDLIAGHLIPEMNRVVFDALLNKVKTDKLEFAVPPIESLNIQHELSEYWDISEYHRIKGELK